MTRNCDECGVKINYHPLRRDFSSDPEDLDILKDYYCDDCLIMIHGVDNLKNLRTCCNCREVKIIHPSSPAYPNSCAECFFDDIRGEMYGDDPEIEEANYNPNELDDFG